MANLYPVEYLQTEKRAKLFTAYVPFDNLNLTSIRNH